MLFIDYLPAELKVYKGRWCVIFHVKNPKTGKLHRKEIRVNRIKSITERKKFARKIICDLNDKLRSGWNPFVEQEAPRGFIKLIEALDIYLRTKTKELSNEDSTRTYKSMVESLKNYVLKVLKKPDIAVISFDALHARNYMDYIYNVREIGGTTFNNYKIKTGGIWNWFIENLYSKSNPFDTVKKKKQPAKKRKMIDAETRTKIKEYLTEKQNYEFLTVMMLCFHGFIRPKEICLLKPEYFFPEKRMLVLPAEITKDKTERFISLSDELIFYLEKINIARLTKNEFIFKYKNSRYVGKDWDKLRIALNLPEKYTFYSLKDTGIITTLRSGVNSIDVRDQAGHSSLEQTNDYAKYARMDVSEEIINKSIKF